MTLTEILTNAIIDSMLWSTLGDTETGEPMLDATHDREDVAFSAYHYLHGAAERFLDEGTRRGIMTESDDLPAYGHDLWLTAAHHGCGFWDGDWPEHGDALTDLAESVLPYTEPYVGDDGLIYILGTEV